MCVVKRVRVPLQNVLSTLFFPLRLCVQNMHHDHKKTTGQNHVCITSMHYSCGLNKEATVNIENTDPFLNENVRVLEKRCAEAYKNTKCVASPPTLARHP